MEDALKSIKEFIWDILGYLIPGITLIILFNFIISPEIIENDNFIFDWKEFKLNCGNSICFRVFNLQFIYI